MWCSLVSDSCLSLMGFSMGDTLPIMLMGNTWLPVSVHAASCGLTPPSLRPSLPSLRRWFSIVLYLFFLFAVIVVLLNLLIAQMSDTYAKTREDVEGYFAFARARIIARLQRRKWLLCKEVRNERVYIMCICSHLV